MKSRPLPSLLCLFLLCPLPAGVQAQRSFDLLRTFEGQGLQRANGLAWGDEQVYLSGAFSDTLRSGALSLVSEGSTDAFFAAFSPDGTVRWMRRFGGTSSDEATAVTAPVGSRPLNAGIVGGGAFTDRLTYGGLNPLFARGNNRDIFLVRLSATGGLAWIRTAGGAAGDDHLHGLIARDDGSFCAAGAFDTEATFDAQSVTSNGRGDAWVACFTADGALQWIRTGGGASDGDVWRGITTGTQGEVYVVGTFQGTATFGGRTLISRGGAEVMFARYSATGDLEWIRQGGGTSDDAGLAATFLRASPPNYGVVFSGTVGARGGIFEPATVLSEGGRDIFVARYTPSGQPVWARTFGSIYNDAAPGLAQDPSGAPLVLVGHSGTAAFGPQTLFARDSSDVFVATLNPATGAAIGILSAGGSGPDVAGALVLVPGASMASSSIYLAGEVGAEASFGTLSVRSRAGAPPRMFVARAIPAASVGAAEAGSVRAGMLGAPWPQPARGMVHVSYTLPPGMAARLTVMDALGRLRVVVLDAGARAATFDVSGLASGLYLLRLEAGGVIETRPFVVAQ